jgi:hypothetical protein
VLNERLQNPLVLERLHVFPPFRSTDEVCCRGARQLISHEPTTKRWRNWNISWHGRFRP